MLDGADAHLPAPWVGVPVYERSQHPAPHSIAFGSIVGDPRPHRGERVGKALGVPAPIHQRTNQKRVSRREPLGRRFVSRGKPTVAQPRHPSEPSVRAAASDPQRDAARLDGAPASAHKARPWLAPMAFLDPVDPSSEGLLWPGCVGFCIVARAATSPTLLLLPSWMPQEKSESGTQRPIRMPVVREDAAVGVCSGAALVLAVADLSISLCDASSRPGVLVRRSARWRLLLLRLASVVSRF